MKKSKSLFLSIVIALAIFLQPFQIVSAETIPITGPYLESIQPASVAATSLASFVSSVAVSGNPNHIAGIFARGLFAAPIVQQPSTEPGFVSNDPLAATQFSMAAQYGTVALLAHNYLLGSQFFAVEQGKILSLVHGDGQASSYRVKQILRYQALSPNSPYSDFLDLDDPNGAIISVADLFSKVYTQNGQLVLQTCIEANGEPTWGRLFVIAEPANIVFPSEPTSIAAIATMAIR